MNYWIDISTIIVQLLIFFQDLKYRAVHYMLFLVLLVLGCIDFFKAGNSINSILIIYGYVFICLLGGYLYFVIKNKAFINPFKSIMGIGDIAYFIAVIPFFNLPSFALYFILGLFFSMILFFLLKKNSKTINTVPLAGFLALFFILFKVVDLILVSDLFHNNLF